MILPADLTFAGSLATSAAFLVGVGAAPVLGNALPLPERELEQHALRARPRTATPSVTRNAGEVRWFMSERFLSPTGSSHGCTPVGRHPATPARAGRSTSQCRRVRFRPAGPYGTMLRSGPPPATCQWPPPRLRAVPPSCVPAP